MKTLKLESEQFLDCLNITGGIFAPLEGFMSFKEVNSVLKDLYLLNSTPWTIPISLDVPYEIYVQKNQINNMMLEFNGKVVGSLEVEDFFELDQLSYINALYGTEDGNHPGVKQEMTKSKYRVAGKIKISKKVITNDTNSAGKIKSQLKEKGWSSIVGFQTRNPIHRAHEYLQRTVLELFDGLFINPLTGWKKKGDFTEKAVLSGYEAMIKNYYSGLNVFMKPLRTAMKYAGPKEAIHHAILRRNIGCTHFIVGRDHAGVANYYGDYEAHSLIKKLVKNGYDIGIDILLMKEPVFCNFCGHVVTENSCSHKPIHKEKISGTQIRLLLKRGEKPPVKFMREEVSEAVMGLGNDIFINS